MKHHHFILALLTALTVAAAAAAEIRKSDGTVYSNATVEQVDPAGLTISFVNENGTSVLKRIPFEELDATVQQQYRYDPERARRYEERREQLSRDSIEELKVTDTDQTGRAEAIRAKLRERFNGNNVEVSRDDLLFLIRSNRRALRVSGVEAAQSGTLVRVLRDDSGLTALPMMILADGLTLRAEESWTGFLYPTGLKARIQGNANLPVFCATAEMAADLVSDYLDIYYQFAASGKSVPADGAANSSGTGNSSGVAGIDTKDKSSSEPVEFGNIRNFSGFYYFGNNYYPVWWYYGNWWNRYPGRPISPISPRPPRPPRPPFPPPCQEPSRPPSPPGGGSSCPPPQKPGCSTRPIPMDRLERPAGSGTATQQRPGTIQAPARTPEKQSPVTRLNAQPERPAGTSTLRTPSRSGNIIPAAPVNSGGRRAVGRF